MVVFPFPISIRRCVLLCTGLSLAAFFILYFSDDMAVSKSLVGFGLLSTTLAATTAASSYDMAGATASATTSSSTSVAVSAAVPTTTLAVSGSNSILLQLTDSLPSDISAIIDPSFAGFGIEPSNLFSFMGGATKNELTVNLLQNLANYTGKPPHFRIGGNTQDYMIYDEGQDKWAAAANPDPVGPGALAADNLLIGPRFFEAVNRLPVGTPVTWGLNMAYDRSDYATRLVDMANQVFDRCTNLNIVSFEVGNEVDLYNENGFRDSSWQGENYVQEWLERTALLYEQVLLPKGLPTDFFEAGTTSHTSFTSFEIDTLAAYNITAAAKESDTGYVTMWNQHDYSYFVNVTESILTLESISSMTYVENQFGDWKAQLEQANTLGYPFALREMGMVGPLGVAGISDTFAGALYTLNFLLYAASINVSSVQFHMTANSHTSAWQPIEMHDKQPFVRPLYYGSAAFNQIIGPSCTAQVSQYSLATDALPIPDGYDGYIRAYSVFQAGSLASIVVINSKVVNGSNIDAAPNITMQVSLPTSLAGQTVHLSYLTNDDGADATSATTWNGISYESNGDGTPAQVSTDDDTVQVASDGSLSFTVRDSQAVVANIGDNKVGSGLEADKTACTVFAARSPTVSTTATSYPDTTSLAASTTTSTADSDADSGSATVMISRGVMFACLAWSFSMMAGVLLF